MAGSSVTTGTLQGFYVKLENIPADELASTTFGDFVGAGKIIDPTSDTTYLANAVAVIGDVTAGGSAKTVPIHEWQKGDSLFVVGQNTDPIEFEVLRDRKNTMAKTLENVGTSTACWLAVLTQDVSGRGGAASDATVHVTHGTISSRVDYKGENPSTVMVTIAPRPWKPAIDA